MKHILGLICALGIAGTAAAQDVRVPIRKDLVTPPRVMDNNLQEMQTRALSYEEKKSFVSAALKINLSEAVLNAPFELDLTKMEFRKTGKAVLTLNTQGNGDIQIFQASGYVPFVRITGETDVWFDITDPDADRWLVTVYLQGQGANPISFKYSTASTPRTDVLPLTGNTVYNFVVERSIGPRRLELINESGGAYVLNKFEVTPID